MNRSFPARIAAKINHYHSVGGLSAVVLFLFSKISRTKPVFKIRVDGVKHPIYIRIGTTDGSVFKQVLVERQYDYELPIAPKIIIDAGANIGLSSVFFANRYPDALIFAVEPETSNLEMLQRNVAPYPQIKVLKGALWGENRRLSLLDPKEGNDGFQTKDRPANGQFSAGDVRGMTVDALMTENGVTFVDVLKIDIEGAEKEVFQNASGWIDRVGVILAELHDHIDAGCSVAFSKAVQESFLDKPARGETVIRIQRRLAA